MVVSSQKFSDKLKDNEEYTMLLNFSVSLSDEWTHCLRYYQIWKKFYSDDFKKQWLKNMEKVNETFNDISKTFALSYHDNELLPKNDCLDLLNTLSLVIDNHSKNLSKNRSIATRLHNIKKRR